MKFSYLICLFSAMLGCFSSAAIAQISAGQIEYDMQQLQKILPKQIDRTTTLVRVDFLNTNTQSTTYVIYSYRLNVAYGDIVQNLNAIRSGLAAAVCNDPYTRKINLAGINLLHMYKSADEKPFSVETKANSCK